MSADIWNCDEFKVVDGTHVKVHQDACYFLSNPQKQRMGKTKGGRNSKIDHVDIEAVIIAVWSQAT